MNSEEQHYNALPLLTWTSFAPAKCQLSDRVAELLSLRIYYRLEKLLSAQQLEQLQTYLLEQGSSDASLKTFVAKHIQEYDEIVSTEAKKFAL